jgi:serine/alanine racemase
MKKYYWLDVVKFILSFLVIAIHIGPFTSYNSVLNYFFCEVLARIAVPFFFISSAFLFYVREKKIKRYCLNCYRMYVVWTIVYLPLYFIKFSELTICDRIKSFFVYGTYTHLWYLLACSIAPLVLFILEKITNPKICLIICIILFAIGACSQTYYWLAVKLHFVGIIDMLREIFLSLANGVFFAPIFFCLGKMVATMDRENKIYEYKLKRVLLVIVICFFLLIGEAYLCWKVGMIKGFEFYFSLIPLSYYILIFVLKLDYKKQLVKKNVSVLRSLSTIVFLIHLYVKECVIFLNNTLLQYFLCCIMSLAVGMILLFVMRNKVGKIF